MMVGRIKNMVLDVLYYAKERELEKATCKVTDFAEETASIIRPRLAEPPLTLDCDFAPELADVVFNIDEDQLRSALVNVLENAVDACRENVHESHPRIIFRVYIEKKDVVFDIQDNGIGMSDEVQAKIFTLFFSSKSTQGTGIGLFITQKIIHQHGGEITVTSKPGRGTNFQIRIPLDQPRPA
jgi:signal transduction histidine kinase